MSMTKSRTIAKLLAATGRTASFVSVQEEPGVPHVYLTTDRARWADMGQPEEITITLEPGDQLNDGSERHDDATMSKVFDALRENGYLPADIPNVITSFQNRGILFRERA